jgi:hypothetical protein
MCASPDESCGGVVALDTVDVLVAPQPASAAAASITKASLAIERRYRRQVGLPLRPG